MPAVSAKPVKRQRRALSHVGGKVELRGGSDADRAAVQNALSVGSAEDLLKRDIQGFHNYAARMHPTTAERLIRAFCPRVPSVVLDPFCGSGTVPVEARRLGHRAIGADLSPLAVQLSRLKTRGASPSDAARLREAAAEVAEHAEERRQRRAGPSRPYPPRDREVFEKHVLLELDGLKHGIDSLGDRALAAPLSLVLSSLLAKVRRSRERRRGLKAGLTIRFFTDRANELADKMERYAAELPTRAPLARIEPGDARRLQVDPSSVDLILTSPPYPGVYDYHSEHAQNLRWLALPAKDFGRREIGSRRQLSELSGTEALSLWEHDFGIFLRQARRALKSTGALLLVLGDAVLKNSVIEVDRATERLAGPSRLKLELAASQLRPHFFGAPKTRSQARREHVLMLRRAR